MIRTTALFVMKLVSGQHLPCKANKMHLRLRVIGENVISDHNHKPYRHAIRTIRPIPITPNEVFDPEGSCLLGKLAAKGGVAGDDNINPCALSESWSKNSD
jgi:hypothetical protein